MKKVSQQTLDKAALFLMNGFSRRHIVRNLMKGEISDPTIVKYLSDVEGTAKKLKDTKIINSYLRNNGNLKATAEDCKSCSSAIINILHRNNIPKINFLKNNQHARKNKIKEDFFEKIDNEEKAYFLGYFFADGNVSIRKDKRKISTTISKAEISQAESDRYILSVFSSFIYGFDNTKIYKYKNRPKTVQDKAYVSIHSKKMCEDLIKLGCVPNKSLILKFPTEEQVPNHLLHHFIRGYFDGDGSVGVYNNNSIQAAFFSSEFFIKSLSKILTAQGIKNNPFKCKNIFHLRILGGEDGIKKFYNFIYKDSTIWLKRKRGKFDEMMIIYEKRKNKHI